MAGLEATSAAYVLPLDADDLLIRGVLARMADALDADPRAAACVGDIEEFGDHALIRRVPRRLDPYRVAYTNEYPITALFRRSAVEAASAWRPIEGQRGYEDWRGWMALAERGERIVHLDDVGYRRRLHGQRLNTRRARGIARTTNACARRTRSCSRDSASTGGPSDLSRLDRVLYPIVFGARASVPFERRLKPLFDRLGLWTRADRG